MSRTKENFRCSVPESNNLVRVTLERYSESAAESKICDLQNPSFLVQKQILGLQIAVEDAMGVTVGHPLAQLVEEALDHRRRQGPRTRTFPVRIDELLEIGVEVLEDEVEDGLAFLAVDVLNAEKPYDVERLREHLQKRDLAERGGRDAFFVHLQTRLLQRDQLACGLVLGLIDLAVRAFSYLLQLLVFLHF